MEAYQILSAELSIIDIAIGLIILWSILAPIFQKKKKQQAQKLKDQEFGETENTVSRAETHPYGSKYGKYYSSGSLDDEAEESGKPYGKVYGQPKENTESYPGEKEVNQAKDEFEEITDSIKDFFKLDGESESPKQQVRKTYDQILREEKARGSISSEEKDLVVKQRKLMDAAEDVSLTDLSTVSGYNYNYSDDYHANTMGNSRADEIRKILMQPSDLGKYVIISEILDKPKAFRRIF